MTNEKSMSERIRDFGLYDLQSTLPGLLSEVVSFFEKHQITYSFDRFANRYQAIIRDVATGPGVDQAIVIHVHVDEDRRFLGAEVRDSFTAP